MLLRGPKKRPIYDKEEADEKGIKYKYWKDYPHEEKSWILTDDDKVVQVIAIHYPKRKPHIDKYKIYRTTIGNIISRSVKAFSYDAFVNKRNMFSNPKAPYKNYLTAKERLYAELMALGASTVVAAQIVWPRRARISIKINRLIRSEVFVKYLGDCVMKNYDKVLEDAGITKSELLQAVNSIATSKVALEDPKYAEISLKALINLLALYGITPEKETKQQGIATIRAVKETHITKSLLSQLQAEKGSKELAEHNDDDDYEVKSIEEYSA